MTLEDRERNFEKALGRELKAKGASGLDCPDTETLAAYHERMLSPVEMAAQKTHIAACPRCQEILATLEVTEAIPSGVEDSEKTIAKMPEQASLRAKSASVREMPKRRTYLPWAVPAGAIAAGLLVWIAINTTRTAKMSDATAPVQIAENREQKEAPPSAAKPETKAPASSAMSDQIAMDELVRRKQESEEFAAGDLAKTQNGAQDKGLTRGRVAAPAPSYSHGPRQMQNQANQAQNQMLYQRQNNGQIAAQNQPTELDKLDGVTVTGKNATAFDQKEPQRSEIARKAVPAAPSPAPPPAPAASAGATGGGVSRADAEAKKEQDKDQKVAAMSETVELMGEAPALEKKARGSDASRVAAANSQDKGMQEAEKAAGDKSTKEKKAAEIGRAQLRQLHADTVSGGFTATSSRDSAEFLASIIGTPDPKIFWIITRDGEVFRSEDQWKTTKKQEIGKGIKAIAGSAPDEKTCWLLAEKGIVLRTKDGGKKWITVTAPADGNFTMITGFDAGSALITDASRGVSYSTTDGGATWKVVPQK